ncbi:MAG TPA: mechanosensitive ion channel family protein [Vicinamibacterales bacterium]|nr:mechanosensitive ion channel family protein [Vicinamibacterales bacterium]
MPDLTNYNTLGYILAAFLLAALIVRLVDRYIHHALESLEIVGTHNREALHQHAAGLVRGLTLLAYGVAAIASVSLALARFGINDQTWDPIAVAHWAETHGVNLLIILAGAFIVVRSANLAIEHLQFKIARRHADTDLEWQRRAQTLTGLLTRLVTVSIGLVASLMLLRELSLDVMPILTGAGIAGLAIGFGAQNLVRDVISGFFMILEDQVRVGDLVRINTVGGTVEQINLRTMVLRDAEGAVHMFPNGTITALANLSKQYAYATVDVRVAYGENLERVMGTIREVGTAIERDPAWGPVILAPLNIVGVETLGEHEATIRMKFKTLPLNQGKVASELRRRVMVAFVGRSIKPYG